MGKLTLGIICHIEPGTNQIEEIQNFIETLGGDVCYVTTSLGKLWITEEGKQ